MPDAHAYCNSEIQLVQSTPTLQSYRRRTSSPDAVPNRLFRTSVFGIRDGETLIRVRFIRCYQVAEDDPRYRTQIRYGMVETTLPNLGPHQAPGKERVPVQCRQASDSIPNIQEEKIYQGVVFKVARVSQVEGD
jgi:hypothetical protein